MVRLTNISFVNSGRRIEYSYTVGKEFRKYFSNSDCFYAEYDVDVSAVPYSIAVIPFLANIMPIAWFLDCQVEVNDVDSNFLDSLDQIRKELSKDWKEMPLRGDLIAEKITVNAFKGDKCLMLYSGGVDAAATYLRHRDKNPDLVTVLGADIPVHDDRQWGDVTKFVGLHPLTAQNRKYRIKSNLRDFYTFRVDLLVDIGWWGKVQHGLALLGITAPLSYVNQYKGIYFASSQADGFAWGSHPKIDDKVRWADLFCKNDGFELRRQQKIDLIVDWSRRHSSAITLRVCYSELNMGLNCGRCEKCYRTILGLILADADPNDFGFSVDGKIYAAIFWYFEKLRESSKNLVNLWKDIADKASSTDSFHVFSDPTTESEYVHRIASGEISFLLRNRLNESSRIPIVKFFLMNHFRSSYRLYNWLKTLPRSG